MKGPDPICKLIKIGSLHLMKTGTLIWLCSASRKTCHCSTFTPFSFIGSTENFYYLRKQIPINLPFIFMSLVFLHLQRQHFILICRFEALVVFFFPFGLGFEILLTCFGCVLFFSHSLGSSLMIHLQNLSKWLGILTQQLGITELKSFIQIFKEKHWTDGNRKTDYEEEMQK